MGVFDCARRHRQQCHQRKSAQSRQRRRAARGHHQDAADRAWQACCEIGLAEHPCPAPHQQEVQRRVHVVEEAPPKLRKAEARVGEGQRPQLVNPCAFPRDAVEPQPRPDQQDHPRRDPKSWGGISARKPVRGSCGSRQGREPVLRIKSSGMITGHAAQGKTVAAAGSPRHPMSAACPWIETRPGGRSISSIPRARPALSRADARRRRSKPLRALSGFGMTIGAATKAAVDQHRQATADCRDDVRECFDRRSTAVVGPAQVGFSPARARKVGLGA